MAGTGGRAFGTGTITFGPLKPHVLAHARFGIRVRYRLLALALAGIAEPVQVHGLLVQVIGEARRRAAGDRDDSLF